MSKRPPKRNAKNQGQPSPLSVFILVILAWVFDAPLPIILILAVIGIIVWRIQKAANKMAKLPPLPPREQESGITSGRPLPPQADGIDFRRTPRGLEDTSWGRDEVLSAPAPSPEPDIKPIPNPWNPPQPQQPEPPEIPPVWQPRPVSLSQAEAPPQTVIPTLNIRPSTTAATAQRRGTRRHASPQGLSLNSQAGLRQAVIAMTVLGPCRALNPYQEPGAPTETGSTQDR